MRRNREAWTSTLAAARSGQLSLFADGHAPRVAVLELRGTYGVVQAARATQWTAYGLSVVLDELGVQVATCTPETMDDYDVVLYSITSPVDQLAMVTEMPPARHRSALRSCRVVVGGQGAYPVWALRDIVDRVHFGRAEGAARQICLTDEWTPYQYDPARDYELRGRYLVRPPQHLAPLETSVGCRQACLFCQYTYTRPVMGQKANVAYTAGRQGHTVAEDTIATIDLSAPGRRTTALDGWSEETRKRVRKGVTDDYLIRRFRRVIEEIDGTLNLKIFQIVGYPWETPESVRRDVRRMGEVLAAADAPYRTPGRLLIMFLNTPFSPEPLTPMEDERANIDVNWRDVLLIDGRRPRNVYHGRNIEAFILPQVSGPLTLLRRVAVNRGASAEQLRALARVDTLDAAREIVPGIHEPGAGLRVSDYLGVDFLPGYKAGQFKEMDHGVR